MSTINTEIIMKRIYRVHLLKKLSGKFCMFVFATIIGMTFVSTVNVFNNLIHVVLQLNARAFFVYIESAFIHTEHLTYVAMTLSVLAVVWMIRDIYTAKMTLKTRRIELL